MRSTRAAAGLAAAALLALITLAACSPPSALLLVAAQPFEIPPLDYAYDALEPVMSERVLRLHHLRHHAAYATQMNTILTEIRSSEHVPTRALAKRGLDAIMSQLNLHDNDALPVATRERLRNFAGGFVNHAFWWKTMRPVRVFNRTQQEEVVAASSSSSSTAVAPSAAHALRLVDLPAEAPHDDISPRLLAALVAQFGSFEQFRAAFNTASATVFGSGWAWLYVDGTSGVLRISSTRNQDSPVFEGKNHRPILALDVWEHAYYIDYEDRRREFIAAWWHLVNWPFVAQKYDEAMQHFAEQNKDAL